MARNPPPAQALEDSSKLESGAFYFDRRPARKHLWLSGTGYSQNDVESLWSQLEEMCGAREGGGGGTGSE